MPTDALERYLQRMMPILQQGTTLGTKHAFLPTIVLFHPSGINNKPD